MPKIVIKCEHFPSRMPLSIEVKARPKTTVARIKEKVLAKLACDHRCPIGSITTWLFEIPFDDSTTQMIEISDADDRQTAATMGFGNSWVLLLEANLLGSDELKKRCDAALEAAAQRESERLWVKHSGAPLRVLWEALTASNLPVGAVMAIVQDKRCGIEYSQTITGSNSGGFFRRRIRHRTYSTITPLIVTTFAGRLDVMKALIAAGAKMAGFSLFSFTALHAAARTRNAAAIELLVANGARTEMAVKYRGEPVPIWGNDDKDTLLHVAAACGSASTVRLLVDKGLPLQITNGYGASPLHLAAKEGNLATMEALFELGAAIDATAHRSETPLFMAVANSQLAAAGKLLSFGAKTEFSHFISTIPLHNAAKSGDLACMQLLIDHGANIHVLDRDFRTPLHHAANHDQSKVIDLLIGHGADRSKADKNGDTPLHLSSESCQVSATKALLENGANINAANAAGKTALHACLKFNYGYLLVADYLIACGADVNAQDKEGNTPLHKGDLYNTTLTISLIDHGADISAPNNDGDTPLHMLAKMGFAETHVKLLLDEGAAPTATNKQKQMPLEMVDRKAGYVPYGFRSAHKDRVIKLLTPK